MSSPQSQAPSSRSRAGSGLDRVGKLAAILGPTNTGKTHHAIERMLAHPSGMIGFPLRLLARENYDRIAKRKGADVVALITGEEKIVPKDAAYFVCTVEAMPLDREVSFLAIDEIQLCGDPERGHVFTDRLLHARGRDETMLLGAETIRPLLRRLTPRADHRTRPRLSSLAYDGARKLTRLPPRSAVVAFSANDVYGLAEMLRRQRGGAAVVLGALSPRARNAQVEMYQSGEVDYLVATDAIGMGLNMDLDHVAFARRTKFDGRRRRALTAAEVAQIAGRAGRHMADGAFGCTAELVEFDEDLVRAVETHEFPPLKALYWRNRNLKFDGIERLLRSLERGPASPDLLRARDAVDHLSLRALSKDREVTDIASAADRVALLWDVCQIPDFHKTLTEQHTGLVKEIFRHLTTDRGRLPDDWVAERLKRIDRIEGDIDTLTNRLAHIRTWTYITHRGDWVNDSKAWQEKTLALEERLSDALHERLTQRFVDRRSAVLTRLMGEVESGRTLSATVSNTGSVLIEGEYVGQLEGFRFTPDLTVSDEDARPLLAAARRALAMEIPARVGRLEQAADTAFSLSSEGRVLWNHGAEEPVPVARIVKGGAPLSPQILPLPSDLIDSAAKERIRKKLATWLSAHLRAKLAPLFAARETAERKEADGPGGAVRAIAYRLTENLGCIPRAAVREHVDGLGEEDRKSVARIGVRIGTESLLMPGVLKPEAAAIAGLLWCVHEGRTPIDPPPPGRVSAPGDISFDGDPEAAERFYAAVGFRLLRRKRRPEDSDAIVVRAVRSDILERLAFMARKLAKESNPFTPSAEMLNLAGCSAAEMRTILEGLGYRATFEPPPPPKHPPANPPQPAESQPGKIAAEVPTDEPAGDATARATAAVDAPLLAERPGAPSAESKAEPNLAVGQSNQAQEADQVQEAAEPVWVYRSRRPERRGRPHSRQKGAEAPAQYRLREAGGAASAKPSRGREAKGKPPRKTREQPSVARPPRREREPDPDSPFAVLADLKAQLQKRKT